MRKEIYFNVKVKGFNLECLCECRFCCTTGIRLLEFGFSLRKARIYYLNNDIDCEYDWECDDILVFSRKIGKYVRPKSQKLKDLIMNELMKIIEEMDIEEEMEEYYADLLL